MADTNNLIELRITGMSCSGCSGRVERMLRAEPGVLSARVDIDAGVANVEVAEGGPSPRRLSEIVEDLGYQCGDCMGDAWDRQAPKKLKRR